MLFTKHIFITAWQKIRPLCFTTPIRSQNFFRCPYEEYHLVTHISYVHLIILHIDLVRCLPEEALTALAGHGVKVKSGSFISTNAADPRSVAVELILTGCRRAHGHGIHYWKHKNCSENQAETNSSPASLIPDLLKHHTYAKLFWWIIDSDESHDWMSDLCRTNQGLSNSMYVWMKGLSCVDESFTKYYICSMKRDREKEHE